MRRARPPAPVRHTIAFKDRASLHAAAAHLMDDPKVECCSFDLDGLVVEVALTDHVARREELAADWRRSLSRSVRKQR